MLFHYLGNEYDLLEMVGNKDLFKADNGKGHIITKDGMKKLMGYFPQVDCTFGPIENITFNGIDILLLEATAFNKENTSVPPGRSFGEVSKLNLDEKWGIPWPIATLECRSRNRAVLAHLGITSVFSEEELGMSDVGEALASQTQGTAANTNGMPTDMGKLSADIKNMASMLDLSDSDRMDLYREAYGNLTMTVEQINAKLSVEIMQKVYKKLKARL
jgi:hypothetical protein